MSSGTHTYVLTTVCHKLIDNSFKLIAFLKLKYFKLKTNTKSIADKSPRKMKPMFKILNEK